ncbi:MAG: hypothetical protein CMP31_13135 [Roseibacillus sp.]|nr:hypothetical protein [Roseibacillus sp.]
MQETLGQNEAECHRGATGASEGHDDPGLLRSGDPGTLPRTSEGKARSSKNAFKGRIRPQIRKLRALLTQLEREQKSILQAD